MEEEMEEEDSAYDDREYRVPEPWLMK